MSKTLLVPEAELNLIKRAQSGDKSAKEAMVDAFDRLINKLAREMFTGKVRGRRSALYELCDIEQELRICLLETIDKFDADRGFRFSTFFVSCVPEVKKRVTRNSFAYSVSNRLIERLSRINKWSEEFRCINNRYPTYAEISEGLTFGKNNVHFSEKQIKEIMNIQICGEVVSFDYSSDDEDRVSPENLIASDACEDDYYDNFEMDEIRKCIELIDSLLSREDAYIVKMHIGVFDNIEHPYREISEHTGLSVEGVRKRFIRAAGILKDAVLYPRNNKIPA